MEEHNNINYFIEDAITSDFIATSIAKQQTNTNIGAHHIFLEQVREDVSSGKVLTAIEYSAYQEMANLRFKNIKETAFNKFNLTSLEIYHSLGVVKTGDIYLFVFVSSPKRTVIFEALEFIVEEIKTNIPIFAKEFFEDSTHQWKTNSSGN